MKNHIHYFPVLRFCTLYFSFSFIYCSFNLLFPAVLTSVPLWATVWPGTSEKHLKNELLFSNRDILYAFLSSSFQQSFKKNKNFFNHLFNFQFYLLTSWGCLTPQVRIHMCVKKKKKKLTWPYPHKPSQKVKSHNKNFWYIWLMSLQKYIHIPSILYIFASLSTLYPDFPGSSSEIISI